MAAFVFYKQFDSMDCGAACLKMICRHYGKSYTLQTLREKSSISREGVSLWGLSQAAEAIGLRSLGVQATYEQLTREVHLPCIIHWQQEHFIILYKITKACTSLFSSKQVKFHIADPAKGLLTYSQAEFLQGWHCGDKEGKTSGIALILEPTPSFYQQEDQQVKGEVGKNVFKPLLSYLLAYKKLLFQLLISLLIGSMLQLIFPFLTKSIVDVGISSENLNFIYVVLSAQLMLFFGKTTVDFIRSWILLHISTRISVSLLSDFLAKLLRLPLSFFDTKTIGDLMQRIADQHRVELFLTSTSLNTLFSLFNILVFSIVLALFHWPVFIIFLSGTILYIGWVMLFLSGRRKLDFKRFDAESTNQSKLLQMIEGIAEIKLTNSERQKRWEWERIQARLFRLTTKGLALNQYGQAGSFFINEGKNIMITFLAAKAVLEGQMTLGAMLAVQYIIGQLNSPVEQLVTFMQTAQDARLSLQRLHEIHQLPDEESRDHPGINVFPSRKNIELKQVSFYYPGDMIQPVLKNVTLFIPEGKTTAIVGSSGSGKTTLLKLLLKFYSPSTGTIRVGEMNLSDISYPLWRNECGAVLQDGYIFSDTIAANIAVGEDELDRKN